MRCLLLDHHFLQLLIYDFHQLETFPEIETYDLPVTPSILLHLLSN